MGNIASERNTLIAFGALLALLFLAQPAWRGLSRASEVESYAIATAAFDAKVEAGIARYRIGDEDGVPVVRPPPGDVYVSAGRWRFRPVLELEAGRSYRLHIATEDILHGVVIGGKEALLAPGQAAILPVTTGEPGRFTMVCSEYCGLEHNKMRHWVTVIAKP
ncbi:MAG: quinol oxidase [Rhodospirillaceae bacterium]